MRRFPNDRLSLLSLASLAALGFASASTSRAAVIWGVDNLGTTNAATVGDRVVKFNSSNPAGTITTVGATGIASTTMTGLDFNATGALFACSTSSLYSINQATGAATLVGSFGLAGFSIQDMTYDSVNNRMLGVGNNTAGTVTRAYTINLTTGVATSLGAVTGLAAGSVITGMASNAAGKVFLEDINADNMYAQSSGLAFAATSSAIGADCSYSQGMTIDDSGDGTWYLAKFGPASAPYSSDIRTIDPTTGATSTVLGTFGTDSVTGVPEYELGDIAIASTPEPTTAAVLGSAVAIMSLRRRRKPSPAI